MPAQTPDEFTAATKRRHIQLEVGALELPLDSVIKDPRGIMGIRVCVEKKHGGIYRHGFVGRTLSGEFVVLTLQRMATGPAKAVEAKGN